MGEVSEPDLGEEATATDCDEEDDVHDDGGGEDVDRAGSFPSAQPEALTYTSPHASFASGHLRAHQTACVIPVKLVSRRVVSGLQVAWPVERRRARCTHRR